MLGSLLSEFVRCFYAWIFDVISRFGMSVRHNPVIILAALFQHHEASVGVISRYPQHLGYRLRASVAFDDLRIRLRI